MSPDWQSALLDVRDLRKAYGAAPALDGVTMRVPAGAIVVVLGPSGCGKTTLLRVIAGLEHADAGSVRFGGQLIDGLTAHARGFGLMFQDYALFPHRSVAENIGFGLRMQSQPRAAIAARVAELLALVGLVGYDARRVDGLSGGERQRVALARSLAPRPRLLMLDEPLGALDRALRERLLDELRVILKHVGLASLYVTHDQAEAFAIADWLLLMRAGQIEQQGTPEQLYRQPATPFAARFLGLHNLIPATVRAAGATIATLETPLGLLDVAAADLVPGAQVTVVLRPESAQLAAADAPNVIRGVVVERSFRGGSTRLRLQTATSASLEFMLDATNLPAVGALIMLQIRPEATSVITANDPVS